jgi:hypothetical protein
MYHTLDGGSLNAFTPHTIGTKLARVKFPGAPSAALTALFPTAPAHVNTCVQSTVAAQATYTDTTNTENNAAVFKSCTQAGAALPANGVATPVGNTANNTAVVTNDPWGSALPAGGFSDVEPAILPADLGGGNALANANGTATAAGFGQVFGVVVSRPLYRALQVKQGIAANTDALDPNFDPANAPNITSQQYVAIATQGGAYQTDWSPLVGAAAGAGHKVILARRVNSSGTQASSSAFFLENPCAGGSTLTPAAAADSNANFEVFEGSGTGNVKTRITTAGGSAGTDNFAIGVVSAENNWRTESATGGQNGYRFVKVDGVHPEAPAAKSLTGATPAQVTALTAEATANARATAAWTDYRFHLESYGYKANSATGFAATIMGDSTTAGSINTALVNPPTAASCNVFPRGLTLNPAAGSICDVGGLGNTTFATVEVMNGTNFGDSCKPIQATQ